MKTNIDYIELSNQDCMSVKASGILDIIGKVVGFVIINWSDIKSGASDGWDAASLY